MRRIFLSLLGLLLSCAYASVSASPAEAEVAQIAEKYRQWILGSAELDYANPFIQTRYEEMLKTARFATRNFEKDANKDGEPDCLFTEPISVKKYRNRLKRVFNQYLFPLSLAYHLPSESAHGLKNPYYHDKKVRGQLVEIFDNLYQYGWREGFDIGVLQMNNYTKSGYIGYYSGMSLHCLGYALSVFLNKELLQEEKMLRRELSTLNSISKEVGPEFDTPILWQQKGFNTDAIRSMFNVRFCYILAIPSSKEELASQQMSYFAKMLNKSLQIADGWADMIKPDFMGYHHQNAYLNAYASHGFHASVIFLKMLDGSSYQVQQQVIENLAQAVLHSRIYCNKYDVPRGAAGRFPDNLQVLTKNIPVFAYLSQLDTPYKQELEGAFMRLWQPQYECVKEDLLKQAENGISYTNSLGEMAACVKLLDKGVKPEKAPQGFWYYPYGGMGVYRQSDWLLSLVGCSKTIWDYESSRSGENQFGRFARAGVLRVLAGGEPISSAASGYGDAGWHWCRLPGATTMDMPFEAMKPKEYKDSHRQFTPESFLGGVSIDQNNALASLKYEAPTIYDTPLKKLHANKSFFFFDDFVLAMGTGIEGKSTANYPVQTTLFQNSMANWKIETTINGKTFSGKLAEKYKNAALSLTDAQGHAYYIPNCPELIVERQKQTTPNDDNTKTESGLFASARLLHGSNPTNASYLYAMQVRGEVKGAEELRQNFKDLFHIIQQDDEAHIVRFSKNKTTGFALLAANKPCKDKLLLQTDTPCLTLVKETAKNTISLVVQNPEMGQIDKPYSYSTINKKYTHAPSTIQPVQITLKGNWRLIAPSEDVSIVASNEQQTTVRFDCFDGKKIQIELQQK